mmetsp:Transcript_29481/g.82858  ORF Transcript_29481/g.82858 Transcript_29481/m.82858 type:complete len:86 (-) Transcript_29481:63-320(-)
MIPQQTSCGCLLSRERSQALDKHAVGRCSSPGVIYHELPGYPRSFLFVVHIVQLAALCRIAWVVEWDCQGVLCLALWSPARPPSW